MPVLLQDGELLSRLVSHKTGSLLPMELTGLCRVKYLEVSKAIKRRAMAGMTVLHEENGINNCPTNCLCSNNIELDYKVCGVCPCMCVCMHVQVGYFLLLLLTSLPRTHGCSPSLCPPRLA